MTTEIRADTLAGRLAAACPGVPLYTCEGFASYLEHRIRPGDFIYAVLSNDLARAFAKADSSNTAAMAKIVGLVWNHLPLPAWGSPEKVAQWLARRENETDAEE